MTTAAILPVSDANGERRYRAIALGARYAIASYTKALEFRNGKCFRRVTEEGYSNRQGG